MDPLCPVCIRTGSASIEYCAGRTDVNETFQLVSFPQLYGGYRWYFICPSTHRRCQCLYRPPSATRFRSRQGFKVRLLYYSQTQDRATRLMETGRSIARRVLFRGKREWRENYRDWDFPPKPPWMRWKTYNRHFERWEWYEAESDTCLSKYVLRLGGFL